MENDPIESAEKQAALEYLKSGEQTEITEQIEKLVSGIEGSFEDKIIKILEIVKSLKYRKDKQKEVFRKRTADQIISSGFIEGCTDEAVVFVALARATHIPAKYIEALNNEWLKSADMHHVSGHAYAGTFDGEKWRIVDPSRKKIDADISADGLTVFGEGLDSWSLGIRDQNSMVMKFTKFVNKGE